MTKQKSDSALDAVKAVAAALSEGKPESDVWQTFEREMTAVFGQRYFTVLAFDAGSSRMCRLYSNQLDIGPVGGVKRVTRSPWVQHVLLDGKIFVGSTKADVKSAFSEYEKLWSIGCESTLNIPIRKNGLTLGLFSLLDGPNAYDSADLALADVFAQLAVVTIEANLERLGDIETPSHTEYV
jgi:GAF domain-containing protein